MGNTNKEEYEALLKHLSRKISEEMRRQNLEQKELAEQLEISQSSISNITNGKADVSLKKYISVMDVLKLDLSEELGLFYRAKSSNVTLKDSQIVSFNKKDSRNFISNPDDPAFNGQLGHFHIIFHPTNRNDKNCLHGYLKLTKQGQNCLSELEILTSCKDESTEHKIYTGFAVISEPQSVVYILLANEDYGELSFIVYPFARVMRKDFPLKGTMALAATVSSGIDSRLPTVHRLFMSREKLDSNKEKYILSQLLMNESEFLISSTQLKKLFEADSLSAEFIEYFKQHCVEEKYYKMDDSLFTPLIRNNKDAFYDLCILRGSSVSPKNNKISKTTVNNIFRCILENT